MTPPLGAFKAGILGASGAAGVGGDYDLGTINSTDYTLTVTPSIHLDASDVNGNGDGNAGFSTDMSSPSTVETWKDRSGNGNDVTQGTAGSQPLYRTGLLRGMPGIEFDGVDDEFADADFFDDASGVPVDWSAKTGTTIALVIPGADGAGAFGETLGQSDVEYGVTSTGLNATGYKDYEFSANGVTQSGHFLDRRIEGTGAPAFLQPSNPTIIPSTARPFITGAKVDGSGNYEIFYNKKENYSAVIASMSPATAFAVDTTNGLLIGRSGNTAARLKGYICEVLIFNTILDGTDWNAVHDYLAQKYGMNVLAARPGGSYAIGGESVTIAPQFHFDASEADTVLNSNYTTVTTGNPAYLWKDKVHGWYASQVVAAKQPIFVESGATGPAPGGQALTADALYFDGTGDALELWMIQTLGDYLDADKAIFMIVEADTDIYGSWFGAPFKGNADGYSLYGATKTLERSMKYNRLNNVTVDANLTNAAQMIGIWSEDGGKYNMTYGSATSPYDFWVPEDSQDADWTQVTTKWGPQFAQIGGATRLPTERTGQRFKGWVYEMFIWDGVAGGTFLSDDDKVALHDYATAKYGTL